MNKKQLRLQIQSILKAMPTEQYREYSQTICMMALLDPSIIEGETIAVTISNIPEVDTTPLIEALWHLGKRVAVPKCNAKTKEMDFYVFSDFSELETVYLHLREPIPEVTKLVHAENIDVMIVPGVVFDKLGYRVGYGGGFYDRYLMDYSGEILALAFDEQVLTNVPAENHDIPVNRILTQTTVINCFDNREEY